MNALEIWNEMNREEAAEIATQIIDAEINAARPPHYFPVYVGVSVDADTDTLDVVVGDPDIVVLRIDEPPYYGDDDETRNPWIPASAAEWLATDPGYLDTVINRIDEALNEA